MFSFAQFGNQLYTGERSFEIVRKQKIWYAISAILLILSTVALLTRGLTLGLEFTGGTEFRVVSVQTTSDIPGAQAVESVVPGANANVTKVGADSMRVQTDELTDDQADAVGAALAKAYGVNQADNVTVSSVGPSWGETVSKKALQGLIVFMLLVGVVISAYFRTWKMAAAALIALSHDLFITVGIYALVGFEVTPATVIGFLTILGYSLYDTVVVFDKVRENTDHITTQTKRTYSEAANLALNQTLVRSINTSVVALLPIASILFIGAFVLGAGTLKDLSLALFVGVAIGTYSSIFIATPVLADLREREPEMQALRKRVLARRSQSPTAAAGRASRAAGSGGTATAVLEPAAAPDEVVSDTSAAAPPAGSTRPRQTGPRNQPKRKSNRRK
jgi:preprotein translocase subunit SecF